MCIHKSNTCVIRLALVIATVIIGVVFATLCSGCTPIMRMEIPQGEGKAPIIFEQHGVTENPATVDIEEPQVSWMERITADKFSLKDFVFPTKRVQLRGPTAFAPPTPPTPTEKAEGNLVYFAAGAAVLGLIVAGAFAKFGFYKEAGVSALTGIACAVCIKFYTTTWMWVVLIVGSLIVGSLLWAWHSVKNKVPEEFGGKLKLAK